MKIISIVPPAALLILNCCAFAASQEDLTKAFYDLHRQIQSDHSPHRAPFAAAPMRYFLVRGLFGNHVDGYMEETIGRMRALGLDVRFIDMPTEGSEAGDLSEIQVEIAKSDVPIVLFGHSRGGTLIHDSYRVLPPHLKKKVVKVVLLNAPLRGSPAADWILNHKSMGLAARMMSEMPHWGDLVDTMYELSTPVRLRTMRTLDEYFPLTPEDLSKFYIVYSAFDPGKKSQAHTDIARMAHVMKLMEKLASKKVEGLDKPGDGLVPIDSAELPGANYIFLSDMDHEDAVLRRPGWFKRIQGSGPNPKLLPGDIAEALVGVVAGHQQR